jgi:Curlin associated repeat
MLNRLAVVPLVAIVAITAVLTPAQADGVSVTLRPRGESADVIREGLGIYSFFRGLQNRAKSDQRGTNNGAAIGQHGRGNNAYVFQRGRDNSGIITQNGNNNAYGIFQFGRRNSTAVAQNGNGEVGITLQGNW